MLNRQRILIAAVIIASFAMIAMLVYNGVHTGGLLASYVDPPIVGYTAAVGIELAVIGLSIAIGTRKWHGMETMWFYVVLAMVLFVSFLANASEGYLQRYGSAIEVSDVMAIDPVQGVIGLAATGLISIIVMALSEIVGQYLVELASNVQDEPEVVHGTNGKKPTKLRGKITAMYESNPALSNAEIARQLNCDASTVSRTIAPLRKEKQHE